MKILIVEDTEDSRIMLEMTLAAEGYEIESGTNGIEALKLAQKSPPDLIVSDIMMPEMDGFELCRQVKNDPQLGKIPFIFYTATYTERQDEELAFALGATRFIIKPTEPKVLARIIREEIASLKTQDSPVVHELNKADLEIEDMHLQSVSRKLDKKVKELELEREALRKSERKYRQLVESVQDYYYFYTRNKANIFTYVSPSIEIILGYTPEEFLTHHSTFLTNNPINKNAEHCVKLGIQGKEQAPYDVEMIHRNGSLRWLEIKEIPIFDNMNNISHIEGIAHDITERKQSEAMLRQSQKMDALGNLTGGIAHDYNNILGIILGYTEQLDDYLGTDENISKFTHAIRNAANRGSKLTKKLLQFLKYSTHNAISLDVSKVIHEQEFILNKSLTDGNKIYFELDDDLWPVFVDKDDLENAILNICINAIHAMVKNGELNIKTSNESLNGVEAEALNLNPGDYVRLSISDTGCGMDDTTIERMFDPFFTTKGEKGTGLGLSQVYGFLKRSGGSIKVNSVVGKGSRFDLYFPRSHQTISEPMPNRKEADIYGELNQTLLVVDNDPAMIDFIDDVMNKQRYHVLTASGGDQALAILKQESVDLLISNVSIPDRNAYQLAEQVQKFYPETKIQLIGEAIDDQQKSMRNSIIYQNILRKPFTENTLISRVKKILGTTDVGKDNLSGRNILVMDDDEDFRALFKVNLEKLGCNAILASNGNDAIELYQQSLDTTEKIDALILDLTIPGSFGGTVVAEKIRALNSDVKIIVSSGHAKSSEMMNYQDHGFSAAISKDVNRQQIKQILEQVFL